MDTSAWGRSPLADSAGLEQGLRIHMYNPLPRERDTAVPWTAAGEATVESQGLCASH